MPGVCMSCQYQGRFQCSSRLLLCYERTCKRFGISIRVMLYHPHEIWISGTNWHQDLCSHNQDVSMEMFISECIKFESHIEYYFDYLISLTHWSRVTYICVDDITIIGSYNGLSPYRRQAIIWTNAGILFTGPLGTKSRLENGGFFVSPSMC